MGYRTTGWFAGWIVCLTLAAAQAQQNNQDLLMHLPGVGGELGIDRNMVAGLAEGGFPGRIELHDWTNGDPGFNALQGRERNYRHAQLIAEQLTQHARANPQGRIYLTAHSGGTGLAVWTLENLPEDVQVESVLLMMSALSPQYDLSRALARVRGNVYVFWSPYDAIVLGAGTRLMGTIDGVRSDAAGRVGFTMPATGDAEQYRKLVSLPYDRSWTRYDNIGDHVGPMRRVFARQVLLPLLLEGRAPAINTMITVVPTD